MTLRLRPATEGDAAACAAILSDWIAETPWFPDLHSRGEDHDFVRAKIREGEAVLAEAAGAPRGFLVREGDYLACLYVAGGWRSRGIGRRLLDRAKAGRARLHLWTFAANARARAFYRREGFREARRTAGENEEGLPDVEMIWTREGRA